MYATMDATLVVNTFLADEDRASIVTFSHHLHQPLERTSDKEALHDALDRIEARGATADRSPCRKQQRSFSKKGWDVSCSLAKVRGRWHLIEVANVYPL